jgi:hypothetical protein
MSSFSVRAEEQNISKEIRAKAELALAKAKVAKKITGRVAKTAGYAVITGVTGAVAVVPVGLLLLLGYEYVDGQVIVPDSAQGTISIQKGATFSDDFGGAVIDVGYTGIVASVLASSIYGLAKATKKMGQKTVESAKEVRSS